MPNFAILTAENAIREIPNWFAVCMGIGTVFVGLICIIILCSIMGAIFRDKKSTQKPPVTSDLPLPAENRREILAAVCAAAAEDMGTDPSALRILSFKKL